MLPLCLCLSFCWRSFIFFSMNTQSRHSHQHQFEGRRCLSSSLPYPQLYNCTAWSYIQTYRERPKLLVLTIQCSNNFASVQTAGGSLDRRRWRQLTKWNAHSLNFGSSSQKGKKPMPASKHIFKMGSKGTTLRVGSCLPAKFWVLNSWQNCRVTSNSGVVSKMVISTSPPSRQLTFQVVIRKHILKDRDKKCL